MFYEIELNRIELASIIESGIIIPDYKEGRYSIDTIPLGRLYSANLDQLDRVLSKMDIDTATRICKKCGFYKQRNAGSPINTRIKAKVS